MYFSEVYQRLDKLKRKYPEVEKEINKIFHNFYTLPTDVPIEERFWQQCQRGKYSASFYVKIVRKEDDDYRCYITVTKEPNSPTYCLLMKIMFFFTSLSFFLFK